MCNGGKGALFFQRRGVIFKFSMGLLQVLAIVMAACISVATGFAQPPTPPRHTALVGRQITATGASAARVTQYGRLPLSFEANQGQAARDVKFLARGPGYTLFLSGSEAELNLQENAKAKTTNSKATARSTGNVARRRGTAMQTTVLHVKIEGATPNSPVAGVDKLPGVSNYYIGNDPKKWHVGIPTYARVNHRNIYPGVGLVYYGNQQQLEFDFTVAPGTDPGQIQMDFTTARGSQQPGPVAEQAVVPQIAKNGDLVIDTPSGKVRFHAPVVYQTAAPKTGKATDGQKRSDSRQYVKAGYVLGPGHKIGFQISSYDHTRPLVIDPVLSYATYATLGGSNGSTVAGIGVDGSGDTYTVATANLQVVDRVLNSQGNSVLYTTYLGGSGGVGANGVVVDSGGDVYVDGQAGAGLPTTTGAFQASCSGTCSSVAFAAKLSPTGTLVYATYLGGSNSSAQAIAIDASGDAYIAGNIYSTDLPLVKAYQSQFASLFMQELDPTGSQLLYSSYFGNTTPTNTPTSVTGLGLDGSGSIYLLGNGPVPLKNPLEQGVGPMFLAKFAPGGSSLVYSTQLGGSAILHPDTATGLAVDPTGDAYVTGLTWSQDFPITMNAFKASCFESAAEACQNSQVFVTKVDPNGTSLLYSTLIGSGRSGGIAIDSNGNAWITGETPSNYFPVVQPIQASLQQNIDAMSNTDAYLTRLGPNGTPNFSTFLGGSFCGDVGAVVAADNNGNAYVAGTFSCPNDTPADFPIVNPAPGVQTSEEFYTPPTLFTAKVSTSGAGPAISLSPQYVSILELRNVSSAPLTINSITPSSTLTLEGNTCGTSIPGGGSCTLILYANDPYAYVAGTLTISSNAAGSPQQFTIQGSTLGTNQVFASPNNLEFPPQLAGTPGVTHTVTLTNMYYPNPMAVSYIGVDTPNPSESISGDYTETNNCPTTLPAGASCAIQVQFLPTSGADGLEYSHLIILTDNPTNDFLVFLRGIRRSESLAASAQNLQFGLQYVGATPLARVVTLTNTDAQPVSVGGISVSGPFTQTNNCTAPLAPHASCRVAVSFVPTNNGYFTGQLTANFSGQGSPATVSLAGTANVLAAISVSPYSLTIRSYVGLSGTQPVTLTNVSSSTVALSSFDLTPGTFTQTNDCNGSLAAGATCTVNVTFAPTTTGEVDGTLTISFSGQGSQQIVPLTGIASTPLQFTPTSLDFGQQALNITSKPLTVSLSNQSATSVTLNSISVSGDFQLASNQCPNPMTADWACYLQITFTPTALGPATGALTINASDSSTPHTLPLSGTGANLAEVSFSPASLTFSPLKPGTTSAPQTITLQNYGNATLTISNLEAVGDFSQTNTCGNSVAAGASCTISVTFSPTSGGQRTGSIALVDNAPDSPQTVALTGAGTDFGLTGTYVPTPSDVIYPGTTAVYSFTLTPEGGFNQTVALACSGAPSLATCSVSPSSVTLNGTNPQQVILNVTTTAPSMVPPGPRGGPSPFGRVANHEWWMALLWLMIMGTLALAFNQRRRSVPLLAGAVLLAALAMSCGGGGGSSGGGNTTSTPGTPAGTDTLTITGTSGNLQHQASAQLTVR